MTTIGTEFAMHYNDDINIHDNGEEIGELTFAINRLPDIRNDKIKAVKEAIESGTYRLDSRKIAEKLIEEGIF